ncbi:hypothetical protein ACIOGT_29365 [Streptomyces microflavus]|uniref:hypothetical protein n=1 Tax=Streptomyces microflavus TaxID=1919 RepID=UPI0038120A96
MRHSFVTEIAGWVGTPEDNVQHPIGDHVVAVLLREAGTCAGVFDLRSLSSEIAANIVALEDPHSYHVIASTSMSRVQAERHLFGYAALASVVPRLLAAGAR